MKEQLALEAPKPDKMVGKEVEKYVRPDEIPAGAKTIDEVEKQAEENKAKTPEQLKADLEKLRTELAECGAKRGARAFTLKYGKKNYDVAHGKYTKAMQDYIRAEIDKLDISENEKKFHAMQMLDDEWSTLRTDTKARMDGTITGKLVNYLGDKDISKKRRMARIVGLSVGVLAGGAVLGVASAGVFGGAAAGAGAGMLLRGYKGFVVDASRRDRAVKEQKRGSLLGEEHADKSFDDILSAGTSDTSYTENVEANSKESRKAGAKTALFALGGAAIGHTLEATGALQWARDGITGYFSENNAPGAAVAAMGVPTPQNGASFREAEMRQWDAYRNNVGRFDHNLNRAKNPFFPLDAKPSEHAMGPALESRPELDMGIDGWNDLVQDRWVNSPEQFASVVNAMGLDGIPNDIDSADALANHYRVTPADHAEMHGRVIELLQQETTKVYEEPILSDYSSEYGVGNEETGEVDLAWDKMVEGQRGTKIVIEFKDPNTGEMRKIELRKECGGQRIVEHFKAPVNEVPRSVFYPETPVVTINTPTPETPTTPVNPPSTPETPVNPPQPPDEPEPPVIPPTLEPKTQREPTFMDTILGPGRFEPPSIVHQTEQTSAGGRQVGDGRVTQPVVEQFQGGARDAEAGATVSDTTRETVSTSGSMGGTGSSQTQTGAGAPQGPGEA